MKLNTAWMTKPINSLDKMGWGRSGAAAGAAVGGTYGMFSDDSSVLGGAFKGAIAGFGAGKLARFGSTTVRDAAQMKTYKDKSFLSQYPTSGWGQNFQDITSHVENGLNVAGDAYKNLKTTATSSFT